jgi:hypothetical protein
MTFRTIKFSKSRPLIKIRRQKMDEQQFLTPKDVLGYAEEHIVVEEIQKLLNYSLSNNLDDIEIAIYSRTGLDIDLNCAYWEINPYLSISVKHLMNKHRVNYSMTTWYEEKQKRRYLVVNMRLGDRWFFTRFNEIDGSIYNYEKYLIYKNIKKYFDDPDMDINSLLR